MYHKVVSTPIIILIAIDYLCFYNIVKVVVVISREPLEWLELKQLLEGSCEQPALQGNAILENFRMPA